MRDTNLSIAQLISFNHPGQNSYYIQGGTKVGLLYIVQY